MSGQVPRHGHSQPHRTPSSCPVCDRQLEVTRLGCSGCGTELAGLFEQCRFCRLDSEDLETLMVFLASRGNLREVERHLGVSYPTARQRFGELLERLGLGEPAGRRPVDRDQVLADVASGRITPEEAQRLLA
ncbi:DUF2089 family protein [Auraticoccus sp. F435]|uniref:DUF2089 family protein n=1 Tax=Auraticoccus cholistanensis TaxID=2656650 RepID=A0A6A9UY25_9ACTN|nr:DUF2089 domain-containing protein [Auraticoccus cholistanensis]MVA76327.1 DUF2089 family protein [Auraticoccus cholistanensis]